MELNVTMSAADFYKNEMELKAGDSLTLFVRVGGIGSGGFSAGVFKGRPDTPFQSIETSGITFCVTEADSWYFDGMTVDYDDDIDDIVFSHSRHSDLFNPEKG
jgi:iron-sulfur cluster insertion protein